VVFDESSTASTFRLAEFGGLRAAEVINEIVAFPGRSGTRLVWPCQSCMLPGCLPTSPRSETVPKSSSWARAP
jgi:hypothetical protein